ncbi:SH3-like domain-containing protein [Cohaesibacter gelatinilyticus]|uniref:SH3-like domain-containing protein n=2 Tax=Cohaesibacter gelatinilyticus TaxID=372072 RepID=A0A285PE32_9HYPH|nr:SH3 domain-containing protein [Cohaesibacter gelatinilyticus]SNZ19995.1 SH3-like domain-containing protein [Cohaesibacter gelatinilyticus]
MRQNTLVQMAQARLTQNKFLKVLPALILSLVMLEIGSVWAQGTSVGPSGYKVPRFVSLKSDRVNVRGGPSTDHKVKWIFRRAGLPVEIIQEFENWRRVRDSEGEEGWVFHSLLSGRRTALISPWQKPGTLLSLKEEPQNDASEVVKAQVNVLVDVMKCKNNWCQVSAQGRQGWLRANMLWGIYPDEVIEE